MENKVVTRPGKEAVDPRWRPRWRIFGVFLRLCLLGGFFTGCCAVEVDWASSFCPRPREVRDEMER